MWFAFLLAFAAQGADDPRRSPVVIAVERATPAVVTIEVEVPTSSPFFFFNDGTDASEGSGVIIADNGVVLTNAHVVDGARSITVHDSNGRDWPAQLVALESDLDLAVLQLEGASHLPVIDVADSDDLLLGQSVIAIGNPYGLGLTVSTGVLSSTGREVMVGGGVTQTYLQTDAAINPGNSGGALVDIHGRLIGINTFIHASGEGIGFAIPVNRATKIATDLLEYGDVRAPWLGLDLVDLTRRQFLGTMLEEGAMQVSRVHKDGPAFEAGIKPGDLLWRIDGRPVGNRADLNAFLAAKSPGAAFTLDVVREGDSASHKLTSATVPEGIGQATVDRILGVEVEESAGAVLITAAAEAGAWARARLREGDLILAVDGIRVIDPLDLSTAMQRVKARHSPYALFTVRRGNHRGTVQVAL